MEESSSKTAALHDERRSAAEMRDEPDEKGQRNAEKQTGNDGKVERGVFAAVNDVAGQFSQAEGEFVSEIENSSEKNKESTEEEKRATEFAERIHEVILPEGQTSLPCGASITTKYLLLVATDRVHVNTTAVTAGATVYDGDRFSAEAGGLLLVRLGTAMLELAEASVVGVRNRANSTQGMEVELGNETLVFSAERAAWLNVIARETSIRPVADTRTVAEITVRGPQELRICARRGALQFSYRGETRTIAEGKCYRVILDPVNNSPEEKEPIPPSHWPKRFKIVIIGEAAALVGLGIHELLERESPDRP